MVFDPMIDAVACEEHCAFYKAIYDWCLRQMARYQRSGNLEQAVQWGMLAAAHASEAHFLGILADSTLEERLLAIGRSLPAAPAKKRTWPPKNILHVVSLAYKVGGHTRLCRRWIENDSIIHRHDVVLTSQRGSIPGNLKQAVEQSGGEITVLNSESPLLERAKQLREIACAQADVIILHTHMHDPLPVLAFADRDAPPVMLLNHADHTYWLGASVADLVADIRASGQELTRHCRGIKESVILPIPLEGIDGGSADGGRSSQLQTVERNRLGIPQDALVFLTIGSEYKYQPINQYDFLSAAEQILEKCSGAYLIAIGPKAGGRWAAASIKTGGRLQALGEQEDVAPFHAAADIYLEGFPFGSLTALLEAGLSGLPCVGAPGITPSGLKSDSLALATMPAPASVEDYIAEALRLAGDPQARRREGRRLQAAIRENHCGAGWMGHLAEAYARLPEKHALWTRTPQPASKAYRDFYVSCQKATTAQGLAEALPLTYRLAEWKGLALAGGIDQQMAACLLTQARRLKLRTGRNYNWLGDIYASEGQRAFNEKDHWRLLNNFLRSLSVAPRNIKTRFLASLTVKSLIGPWSVGRLQSLKRGVRSFRLQTGSK
jgi:hypothetical protein